MAGKVGRTAFFFTTILILCASYSNTLSSPPFLDDFHSFIFDKGLYIDSLSFSSIASLLSTKSGIKRFIPTLTFALNHKLGNSQLIYFHLVNIFVHLMSFLSIVFLTRQIIAAERRLKPDSLSANVAEWVPLLVAALWATNPVQVSAVTYLVQRIASIAAFFYFLAVGLYIKARLKTEDCRGPRRLLYFGCAISSISAFFSKENALILPFSLILVEVCFFRPHLIQEVCKIVFRTWKSRILICLFGVIGTYIFVKVVPEFILSGYSERHFSLTERVLTEARIVIWYISLLFWPDPARLSMEHQITLSTSLLSPPSTLMSILAIVGLIIFGIRIRKKEPIIAFGILWYFLNIALESSVIALELIFEHRLYLPSFGIFLSFAILFIRVLNYASGRLTESDLHKVFCSVLIVIISISGTLTFFRNEVWSDIVTLEYDNVTKAPLLPRTNSNFANALFSIGEYSEAVKYAERALELNRSGFETYSVAANALVGALMKMGRTEEAAARGRELLEKFPARWDVDALPFLAANTAQAQFLLGQNQEAFQSIMKAFKLIPQIDNSEHKKNTVYTVLREILEAVKEKHVDLNGDGEPDPGAQPINYWIAMELRKIGDFQYSRELLEDEFARNPDEPLVAKAVSDLRREDMINTAQKERWNIDKKYIRHPFSKFNFCMATALLVQEKQLHGAFQNIGERCLNKALEIEPNSPDALLLKGWYAYNKDDAQTAVAAARSAIKNDPDNAKAWLGLGFFLLKAGEQNEALSAFNKVIEIYPGYSKRATIAGICKQIEDGLPTVPALENGGGCQQERSTAKHSFLLTKKNICGIHAKM